MEDVLEGRWRVCVRGGGWRVCIVFVGGGE